MLDQLPKALQGKFIFPIQPGTKDPATRHGWRDATNDPEKIKEWLELNPDFNWGVACGLSDLFVFDIDPAGIDYWNTLVADDAEIKAAVDSALIVQTPKGGFHVYFEGSGPSTASRIAEGIDTRGGIRTSEGVEGGGYVLLPGSSTVAGKGRVEGVYKVIQDNAASLLPDCLKAIVPAKRKTEVKGQEAPVGADNDRNVAWATSLLQDFVKNGRVSVEGAGGNDTAFRVACAVLEKGISPAKGLALLLEHWNLHCSPPWQEWELERVVFNASQYGDDTADGAKGLPSNEEAFATFLQTVEVPKDDRRGRVQWLHDYADNAKPPEWLIPNLLPSSGVAMLYGASQSFKTFVALDFALCLANGVAGQWGAPPVKNDVLYLAGEDPASMALKRWPAWVEHHGIKDRADHRCLIIDHVPQLAKQDEWECLKDDLEELQFKPSLIVVDTLSKLLVGRDENSAKETNEVWAFLEDLSRYYECLVLFIHHTGKDKSKGARGSGLLSDNANAVLYLERKNDEGEGTNLYIKKLKDTDCNPTIPIYLKKTEVGPSLMMVKSDAPQAEAKPVKSSRYPWAEVGEVTALLNSHGGELSHSLLALEIASAQGIEPDVVRRVLSKEPSIQFLKEGNLWRLPQATYDL